MWTKYSASLDETSEVSDVWKTECDLLNTFSFPGITCVTEKIEKYSRFSIVAVFVEK